MKPTNLYPKGLLFLSLALLFSCASSKDAVRSADPVPSAEGSGQVVVLHFSDLHGRIHNYPRLAAEIRREREAAARGHYDVLVLLGGDAAGKGALPCRKTNDKDCFSLLREIQVDVAVLGNGETKRSAKELNELIQSSGVTWIGTNVRSGREKAAWQKDFLWRGARTGAQIWLSSWTIAPTAEELDNTKPLQFIVKPTEAQYQEWAQRYAQLPVLWVTHQNVEEDRDLLKTLCAQKKVHSVAVLRGHTHEVRQDTAGCVPSYEAGAYAEGLSRLTLRGHGNQWQVAAYEYRPLKEGMPELGSLKTQVDHLYGANAQEAEQVVAQLPSEKAIPQLGQWLAESYRKVSKADVAIINQGAIKAALPAGAIKRETLLETIPYNNDLMGIDWPFADLERSLCTASRRTRDTKEDNGSELLLAGAELLNPGQENCQLKTKRKGALKVVFDSFMAKKASRWLGKKLDGRTFKFGLKTEDAMLLALKRSQGRLE